MFANPPSQIELARHFRVHPSELVLFDDLAVLARAFVPMGDLVALAEPTDGAVTRAITAAGIRYLDVGRDARLRVHPDGWRFALDTPRVRLAWLLSPEEPTMMRPSRALLRRAEQRGTLVVLDERFSGRPGAPATLSGGVIRIRALQWVPPGVPERFVALAPGEILMPLRRLARASQLTALPPRVLPWATLSSRAIPRDTVRIGESPVGVCFRVPGVASVEAAASLGLPTSGSPHWTWRDAVRVWAWEAPPGFESP